MLQLSLDDVRELLRLCHRRRRLFDRHGRRRGWSGRDLHGFSCVIQDAEMFPNLVGNFVLERTGMRLLLNP
jgi:hypothetical protein